MTRSSLTMVMSRTIRRSLARRETMANSAVVGTKAKTMMAKSKRFQPEAK